MNKRVTDPPDPTGMYYETHPTGVDMVDVMQRKSPAMGWEDVSLGAIFSGVIIALILQFLFNVLGLSIGANTVNPATEANPIEPALGMAAAIWVVFSTLLALFMGGWVAGRLSNTQNHVNSTLHGIITWAVTSIILLAIVGSSIGGIVSGIGRIVGQGATLLGSGVVQTAPAVIESMGIEVETLMAFNGEFRNLLADPTTSTTDDETATTTQAQNTSSEPMQMNLADLKLSRDVTAFVTGGDSDQTQKQSLAVAIANRTSLTEEEALVQLDNWRESYQDVRVQVEETARDVGQLATETLTAVAGMLAAILFIGAVAAGLGAYLAVAWRDNLSVDVKSTETYIAS